MRLTIDRPSGGYWFTEWQASRVIIRLNSNINLCLALTGRELKRNEVFMS